jgi:hypothetical protein
VLIRPADDARLCLGGVGGGQQVSELIAGEIGQKGWVATDRVLAICHSY